MWFVAKSIYTAHTYGFSKRGVRNTASQNCTLQLTAFARTVRVRQLRELVWKMQILLSEGWNRFVAQHVLRVVLLMAVVVEVTVCARSERAQVSMHA